MRPIDADAISYVQSESGCQDDYALRYDINELPTIDPIKAAGGCYCRECRYWGEDGRCEPCENGLIREYTRPTDFCSYGEPREAQDDG